MKPAWLRHSRDEAELEALQTDVMRFIAIIGLCLAAIFSLVQGAAQEQVQIQEPLQEQVQQQVSVEHTPVATVVLKSPAAEPATVAPAPVEPAPVEKPLPGPPPVPAPAPATSEQGFTLEFASVQALETLLLSGRIALYASQDNQFWSVDHSGQAQAATAPTSYYQMQAETVPGYLRQRTAGILPGDSTIWGVTLPPGAVSSIQQLTRSGDGGSLLIGDDGAVRLAGD